MLSTGQLLSHYSIVRLLKSGGMGEVYLADDMRHHRAVAIKVIRIDPTQYADAHTAEEAARLFLREAQTIAQFDHTHILPLYDSGEEYIDGKQLMYMVMPFRHEGALPDWLHKHLGKARPPLQVVEYIVRQAVDALQHAHTHGVIHQDVKLSNFLILGEAEHPSQLRLQLADFGVAKFVTTTGESQVIRGTPTSMAPEQWEGHAVPATDQYALAVMVYELLTGRSPFAGSNAQQLWYQHVHKQPEVPSAFNPHVPKALNEVLLRALAKHPKDRFPSISAFAQAFRQAIITNATMYQTLTISAAEAHNGTNRTLTLPGRQPLSVSIPAGAHHNQVIRLVGQGTPTVYGGPRGDLILTLHTGYVEEEVSLAAAKTIESTVPALPLDEEEFPPPHRRFPLWQKVLLLSVALLLIVGSASIFYTAALSRPTPDTTTASINAGHTQTASVATNAANNATITATIATAQSNATAAAKSATAQTNATIQAQTTATAQALATAQTQATAAAATAQAQALATTQAQATALVVAANPDPYSPTGTLAFYDPLSQPHYWSNISDSSSGGACQFSTGAHQGYDISQSNQGLFRCNAAKTDFSNFAFEVHINILSGDCGGIIFRANGSTGKSYDFKVCQDGFFAIDLNTGNTSHTVLDQGYTTAIKTGYNRTNVIAAVANKGTIDLYVNSQKIDSITDNTYSQGQVGLFANNNGNDTDVIYSIARIWTF